MSSQPSPRTHRMNRAAIGLLIFAALVMALGVWAQMQQTALIIARADAVAAQGAAGFNSVPVPILLKPFEAGLIPAFLLDEQGQGTVFGVIAKIGGVFGLLGLLLLPFRVRIAPAAIADMDALSIAPAMPTIAPKSDWQFRLAQKMADQSALKQQPKTAGFGKTLYRIAVFVVGIAFLGLTVVLLLGAAGGSGDFGGLAEQTLQTARRAIAGDGDALLFIAQLGAVVVGVLIVLKVLFARRKPAKRRNFAI